MYEQKEFNRQCLGPLFLSINKGIAVCLVPTFLALFTSSIYLGYSIDKFLCYSAVDGGLALGRGWFPARGREEGCGARGVEMGCRRSQRRRRVHMASAQSRVSFICKYLCYLLTCKFFYPTLEQFFLNMFRRGNFVTLNLDWHYLIKRAGRL